LQELASQLALGAVLMTVRGQSAPETGAAFQRAQSLSLHVGDITQRILVLAGLRRFYGGRYEVNFARETAQQMLSLAEQSQNSAYLLEANQSLANIAFWSGEFAESRRFAQRGLSFHNPQQHRLLALQFGIDPAIGCHNFASLTTWFLGYPDQALERSTQALAWSHSLVHAHSQAFALIFAAFLHYHRCEARQVQEYTSALLALAAEHGFSIPEFWGMVLQGWALTVGGQPDEGLSLLQKLEPPQTTVLGLLLFVLRTDALRRVGKAEEGLRLLEKGATMVENQRFWEVEMLRLKGELLLMKARQQTTGNEQREKITDARSLMPNAQSEAEACFLKAIEIAQKQQAKSWELRATTSLARLWQQQGKHHEARNMLAAIYSWFAEGFDTKDLQEAKRLLKVLGEVEWKLPGRGQE
jgi:adenylate cyclase